MYIFFIPRRVDKVIYDTSIIFDEVIITKFYFDREFGVPNSIDCVVTNQENISKIRDLLSEVKVTKLISNRDEGLINYYMLTFRNTKTGDKIKVYIYNTIYFNTSINGFKRYKIFNKEVGQEIVILIESLIS
jgi:sRNA-binding regulator protein Hfq